MINKKKLLYRVGLSNTEQNCLYLLLETENLNYARGFLDGYSELCFATEKYNTIVLLKKGCGENEHLFNFIFGRLLKLKKGWF